jgi:hypothetical protein
MLFRMKTRMPSIPQFSRKSRHYQQERQTQKNPSLFVLLLSVVSQLGQKIISDLKSLGCPRAGTRACPY